MYKIKYSYETGNSFGREDREDVLEFEWKDLEIAKECIRRIKEHYDWYESENSRWADKKEKPSWHNVKTGDRFIDEINVINLPMDNGEEVQFWPPWIGYFETLYGAQIVTSGEDMEFWR